MGIWIWIHIDDDVDAETSFGLQLSALQQISFGLMANTA